jgi:hypothetical protein
MQISLWKRFACSVSLTAFVAVAATTYASGPDVRTVQLRDDCDPATFNADPPAGVGPGTCVGDGDTTFADFLDQVFSEGSAEKWRFNPNNTEAERGVNAHNRGGEFHSFTQVEHFGGGFVEVLNLGVPPVDECALRTPGGVLVRDPDGNLIPAQAAIDTFVPPGGNSATTALAKGVHKFQCCIHPWMHTTVAVK